MNRNSAPRTPHNPGREVKKAALRASGKTYDDLAARAHVSWRMVKYWIDGQRTSARIDRAFEQLTRLKIDKLMQAVHVA